MFSGCCIGFDLLQLQKAQAQKVKDKSHGVLGANREHADGGACKVIGNYWMQDPSKGL
jgi:hypothetical protein